MIFDKNYYHFTNLCDEYSDYDKDNYEYSKANFLSKVVNYITEKDLNKNEDYIASLLSESIWRTSNTFALEYLLKIGVNPNTISSNYLTTAVYDSVSSELEEKYHNNDYISSIKKLELLISYGTNVNCLKDKYVDGRKTKETALDLCLRHNFLEAKEILIKNGAKTAKELEEEKS